jgi:dihydropteroate synthase
MKSFQARALSLSGPTAAEHELRRMGVDPGGIHRLVPKMRSHCIHIPRLQCRQANILKQEMLALGGDAAVARGSVACSVEASDAILVGTEKQLRLLSARLAQQPFGLPSLGEELAALLDRIATPPSLWRTARRDIPLERPLIMGILNITPDSFSDGGRYLDPARAVERAEQMKAEGADIIDIGGESTRPGAPAIAAQEEIDRVVPVISAISKSSSIPLSVDSWKGEVARRAMDAGAEIINDISGLTFAPSLAAVAAETGAGLVLMHTRGTPEGMQRDTVYDDLMAEVTEGLRDSVATALSAGIERERISIDPGIGFGKESQGNLELLRRLREFRSLGLPILVGTSRKSFIGAAIGREVDDRLFGTAATVALAVSHGASILRVHDVRAMRDVADMARAIMEEQPAPPTVDPR